MTGNESTVNSQLRAAAQRLWGTTVPDNVRAAFQADYGLNLGPESTYKDLLFARLHQLAKVDLEAAALLKRYNLESNA